MAQASLSELFPYSFINESTLSRAFGEELPLCENGNMVFHWADFHETCDLVNSQLQADEELRAEFHRKENALKQLKLISVWIRTEKKVHQTSMFELYERYILNQIKLSMGVDPFGLIEISFISSTGPFRSMAIAECFNKNTYKDFILFYLLHNKLPRRDFRVRIKAKVLMEFGADFSMAHLVHLEQLTVNGLLFSLDSDFYLQQVSPQPQLRFLLDTACLSEGSRKNLSELKDYLSQYTFNLLYSSRKEDALSCNTQHVSVQSSFDFLKNKRVYLFVPYNTLSSADHQKVNQIQGFVFHTRDLVREFFDKNFFRKTG